MGLIRLYRSLLRVSFQLTGLFCGFLWIVMCNGYAALFVGLFATRFSGSLSFDTSLFCWSLSIIQASFAGLFQVSRWMWDSLSRAFEACRLVWNTNHPWLKRHQGFVCLSSDSIGLFCGSLFNCRLVCATQCHATVTKSFVTHVSPDCSCPHVICICRLLLFPPIERHGEARCSIP